MCLAVPAQVISIDETGSTAVASLDGVRKTIALDLVDQVSVGDYVLIHVGFALQVISPDEAQKTLSLFREAGLIATESS